MTYLLIMSSAKVLMYPPSMRPGVSITFKVNPALDRDTITGLGPSDLLRVKHYTSLISKYKKELKRLSN